jgi:hypothetical protein
MGKNKYIETPDKMWEFFCYYRDEVKSNPIYILEQKRGNTILPKDLSDIDSDVISQSLNPIIKLPMQRPLTIEGFENWCADNDIIEDLGDYFKNKDDRYSDYAPICSRIKKTIRQDQIEGGMVGIYNPSITQRLNGLVDKKETELKGGLNIPNIPDIGNRK